MANNGKLARLPLGIPLEQRLKVSFRPGNGKSFNLRGGLLFGVRIFQSAPKTVTLGMMWRRCQHRAIDGSHFFVGAPKTRSIHLARL